MFYFPASMALCHVIFSFRSLAFWVGGGYEWWTTPIVVPTRKRIWCIWRLGFWWSSIRYDQIRKVVLAQWRHSAPHFTLVFGEDRAVVLGAFYSLHEMEAIQEAVLYNWRAATGRRLKRQVLGLGAESVIWTVAEEGEATDDTDGAPAEVPGETGEAAGGVHGRGREGGRHGGRPCKTWTGAGRAGGETTWLCPVGALAVGTLELLLLAGIDVLILHRVFGTETSAVRWIFAFKLLLVPVLLCSLVGGIRFFRVDSEAVTVFSWWGLRRKRVRLAEIVRVVAHWEEQGLVPAVHVRCRGGWRIRLNSWRRKLCERLVAEIRRRLAPGESGEGEPSATLPDRESPVVVLLAEWFVEYGLGVVFLWLHWMMYKGLPG